MGCTSSKDAVSHPNVERVTATTVVSNQSTPIIDDQNPAAPPMKRRQSSKGTIARDSSKRKEYGLSQRTASDRRSTRSRRVGQDGSSGKGGGVGGPGLAKSVSPRSLAAHNAAAAASAAAAQRPVSMAPANSVAGEEDDYTRLQPQLPVGAEDEYVSLPWNAGTNDELSTIDPLKSMYGALPRIERTTTSSSGEGMVSASSAVAVAAGAAAAAASQPQALTTYSQAPGPPQHMQYAESSASADTPSSAEPVVAMARPPPFPLARRGSSKMLLARDEEAGGPPPSLRRKRSSKGEIIRRQHSIARRRPQSGSVSVATSAASAAPAAAADAAVEESPYDDWRFGPLAAPPQAMPAALPGPGRGAVRSQYVEVRGSEELRQIIQRGSRRGSSRFENVIQVLKKQQKGRLYRPSFDRATAERLLYQNLPGFALARPTKAEAPSRASGGSDCICLSYRPKDEDRVLHTIVFLAERGTKFAIENDENEVEVFDSIRAVLDFLDVQELVVHSNSEVYRVAEELQESDTLEELARREGQHK